MKNDQQNVHAEEKQYKKPEVFLCVSASFFHTQIV